MSSLFVALSALKHREDAVFSLDLNCLLLHTERCPDNLNKGNSRRSSISKHLPCA